MATTRTDIHRPGAIIPAHYEQVISYSLATSEGGWPVPSIGINCELDDRHDLAVEGPTLDGEPLPKITVNGKHGTSGKCCVIGLRSVAKVKWGRPGSGPGKCDICGTRYVYGDVWEHTPTGEHIHVGHDCAAKYSMMADRSAWELENGRIRQALATQIARENNKAEREAFLAEHPGLEEAFKVEHPIIRDIAGKFHEFRSISDKQIALVFKLAEEVRNPKAAEINVPAPTGRVTFRGTVVSCKSKNSAYGGMACTIKVTTEAGVWLAWGTATDGALTDAGSHGGLKGCEVEVKATLSAGRDPHFAFMKRPVIKVLSYGPDHDSEKCIRCELERLEKAS